MINYACPQQDSPRVRPSVELFSRWIYHKVKRQRLKLTEVLVSAFQDVKISTDVYLTMDHK